MTINFIDGFDKYGPPGVTSGESTINAMLVAEWTLANGTYAIVSPLSSTGYALQLQASSAYLSKTLDNNYGRLIGGVRFKSDLGSYFGSAGGGVGFQDSNSYQIQIRINSGTGTIAVVGYTGTTASVIAQTTSYSIRANSIHYLEWDISFSTPGAYTIYMDGVSILSGTGIMNGGTGNNYVNQFVLFSNNSTITYDDLYLFTASGSTNNAVLLTNPRIETQFPSSSASNGFSSGAGLIGNIISTNSSTAYVHNNTMNLVRVVPAVNMTVNSLLCKPTSNPNDNWTAVVYSDFGGTPHTLLAQSVSTIGNTTGLLNIALQSPLSLTASTAYWIGFMFQSTTSSDSYQSAVVLSDTLLGGVSATVAYGTPPSTAPSMATGNPSYLFYGYCTNLSANWYSGSLNAPQGDLSYVYSSTPGTSDLYLYPNLTTHPTNIYAMAVKTFARLTDTGNRTIDLEVVSGTTTGYGSQTGIIPPISYQWQGSFFETDPNTSEPWTESGVNSAETGVKVAT